MIFLHAPRSGTVCTTFLVHSATTRTYLHHPIDIFLAPSPQSDVQFKLDKEQGWLLRRGARGIWRRVCWLPYPRRQAGKIAYSGERVCIGAGSGVVTLLDFADAC
jgi:hypothetical protein